MAYTKTIIFFLGAVAVASASHDHEHHEEEHHHPSPYKFEYSVHDPHTGDIKEAKESRHGDVVKGFYTLKEADGTTREVHYTADKHNGFQAHVNKIGHAHHHHEPAHHEPAYHHYAPAHVDLRPPVHKFDIHHKHGSSHQYVSLDKH